MTRSIPIRLALFVLVCLHVASVGGAEPEAEGGEAVLTKEFVYDEAPFPQCHASTIAETSRGLVAAWFGGTHEKHPDVGIWVARHEDGAWTAPQEVANGVQSEDERHPCWNPVLFATEGDKLLLFYKVGPSPSTWWGMMCRSADGGRSWSEPQRLPENILGPIKNKPVLLEDGRLLCGSSTEHAGWRVHMEWTADEGSTWERTEALNEGDELHAIQPAILQHGDGTLQILCRSRSGKVVQATSNDGGRSWTELTDTQVPNPNSGIDAVTLADGRHVLIYNNTPRGRTPLNVAVSLDGEAWTDAVVLEDEPGEYSYPAVIQASDGRIHVTYTWRRRKVRHVVLDPDELPRGAVEGAAPASAEGR